MNDVKISRDEVDDIRKSMLEFLDIISTMKSECKSSNFLQDLIIIENKSKIFLNKIKYELTHEEEEKLEREIDKIQEMLDKYSNKSHKTLKQ